MGLFNKANNLLASENLQNESQFSAEKKFAENALEKNKLFAFSDFVKKYGISLFAICQLTDNFFVIKDSLSFDAKTISRFMISVSDCNSIFSENKNTATVRINDFSFLSDVFSETQKQKNQELSFCKISGNFFMICNCEITNALHNDFLTLNNRHNVDFNLIEKKLSQKFNAYIVKIDFQEAIEAFFCTDSGKKIKKDVFFTSVFAEICNRFLFFYNSPYFCRQTDNFILKSCFFTKEKIPPALLMNHIIYNLKDVLDNSAEIINITAEKANNFSEIQNFYEAE